jgi:hypothetical protein
MKRSFVLLLVLFACSSDDETTGTPGTTSGDGGGTPTGEAGIPNVVPDSGGNTGEVTPPRRVFVTEALRSGANGGTAGADAVCAQEAKNANLTGDFIAWLSTPDSKALEKLRTGAAFITIDGKVLWDKRADIEAGIGPKAPITLDAKGQTISGVTHVWTGADGTGKPTAENCNLWMTNAAGALGGAGVFGGIGKEWTQTTAKDCQLAAPLICFEK